MRARAPWLTLLACCLLAPPALGQYAPHLSTGLEFGPELILADDRLSLSGAFQTPLGRQSDIRVALGVEDPDVASSSAVLSGGLRAFLSDVTRGKVLPAMQGQLDFFFGSGKAVRLTGGPSFGVATGVNRTLVPYLQPLFIYKHESGKNDVKLGVRLGADYAMKPRLDLRGDLIISSFLQLRAALAFRIGPRLFGKEVASPPTPPSPPDTEAPSDIEAPSDGGPPSDSEAPPAR